MNTHPSPALDLFYRMLGFAERSSLHLLAKDDRFFTYRDVVCKPDFVILDAASMDLWILDYKTRMPTGAMTAYEAYQVIVFGMAVRPVIERELCRKLKVRTGVLYANDRRLEVVADPLDIERVNAAIEPARRAFSMRGEASGGKIGGSQLAQYLADPTLSSYPTPDDGRRARGINAHRVLVDLAPN